MSLAMLLFQFIAPRTAVRFSEGLALAVRKLVIKVMSFTARLLSTDNLFYCSCYSLYIRPVDEPFQFSAANIWNDLPADVTLCTVQSLSVFRKRLKTFQFIGPGNRPPMATNVVLLLVVIGFSIPKALSFLNRS